MAHPFSSHGAFLPTIRSLTPLSPSPNAPLCCLRNHPRSAKYLCSSPTCLPLDSVVVERALETPNLSVPFDFLSYRHSKILAINDALEKAVPLRYKTGTQEFLRYALLLCGGKRIRPMLCIAACEVVGGTEELAMPAACAIEMAHTASLLHHDLPCMGNDELRRRMQINHSKFGEDTTVMPGSLLLSLAFEHVARATKNVPPRKILRVLSEVGRSTGSEGMVAGAFIDMESQGDPCISLQTLEYIHVHRIAIVLECALVCGAIIGGASEEVIKKMRRYGRNLGLLLQLMNENLDVTKSSDGSGKASDRYLLSDKVAYPKVIGLQQTRQFATELVKQAKDQLRLFDQERAAPLLSFADHIFYMQN